MPHGVCNVLSMPATPYRITRHDGAPYAIATSESHVWDYAEALAEELGAGTFDIDCTDIYADGAIVAYVHIERI